MYTAISQQIDWSSLPAVNNTGSTLPSTATFVNHSTSRSSTSSTITTTTTSTTTHQTTANAFPNTRNVYLNEFFLFEISPITYWKYITTP